MKYELVSGLETHVALATKTKIFCSCDSSFGGNPNSHCCPICMGFPGSLPKLNEQVVEFAIMAGLATNCQINHISKFDRKNYCYPDLSKAYQISQFDMPICINGYIELSNGRKIRINRIHIEEDAGKLIHQHGSILVDYNRSGVPLIEIVTEPDIHSIETAKEYIEKLQMIIRYTGVSDCKMQEGSMRCDVNISVRPENTETFGTRTEIKNMNSITFITKAMEYEIERQIDLLENGDTVEQETRRYNEVESTTESMRVKEDAYDYRYFRDPDLAIIEIADEQIEVIRAKLPENPDKKLARYIHEWSIPEKDAQLLIKYRRIAEFFEASCEGVENPKIVANCILGQIFHKMESETTKEQFNVSISSNQLRELIQLLDKKKISNNLLKNTLRKMLDTGKSASELIDEKDMGGLSERNLLILCQEAIAQNSKAISDYKNGKENALKSLLGYIMKNSSGKANPVDVEKLIKKLVIES